MTPRRDARATPLVYCVDFGSTFTKAALVDTHDGGLVGTASHRTTIDTDVLDGWDAIRAELSAGAGSQDVPVLACSSAGGGLRIAVVGNEELVTAEAGRRVALSSGGRVVHVSSYDVDLAALRASDPDVVLLVGGTDGGNAEVLMRNARSLAQARWRGPVVVAGNADAVGEISELFTANRVPFVVADNVVPRIGVLDPDSARMAIREVFLRHVIGGKHLSRRADFTAMVKGATPDVVLTAVELLANGLRPGQPGKGDVVVIDVGGATTDVHSVVAVDPEEAGLAREVVATVPVSRTVEGDLGMRWSAVPTVEAAKAAGMTVSKRLLAAARERRADPGLVPATPARIKEDLELASIALGLAVRRHAGRQQVVFSPDGRLVERTGKDLREVTLLIGSGGVLRHSPRADAQRVIAAGTGDHVAGGWLVPRNPKVVIDHDYVLAAAGLLAPGHLETAYQLVRALAAGDAG
ncbi:MAG: glutamate mutase L [Nocardioidaceae bacterium]